MEKKAKTIKDADRRASFLADLNSLSNAGSEECFDNVVELFKVKWRAVPDATVALKHFEKEWLSERLTRFYRGAAEGFAMNNNGLESTNKTLKDTATLHEQMPILEFIPTMTQWIGIQSYRRNPDNINYVKIAEVPSELDTKDMTDGFSLCQAKTPFIKVDNHYISISKIVVPFTVDIARSAYRRYCESDYGTMNKYNSFQKYVHVISPTRRCNCYEYGRTSKCKHSTCVKIMIDHIAVPPEARTVPLGCRRKPGRPPMALGRYVVQTYDTSEGVGLLDGEDPGPQSQHKTDLKRKKQKTSSSTAAKTYDDKNEHYEDSDYGLYSGADNDQDNSSSNTTRDTATYPRTTADDSTQRGQGSQSTISGAKHPRTTADDSTQRGQGSQSTISGAKHHSTTADQRMSLENESCDDCFSDDFDYFSDDDYEEEYL